MELDLMFLKKTPPHSPEAEKTILGGILINNKNLNVVLSIVAIEDFDKEGNRKILEKIAQLVDRGLPVDVLSLSEELKKSGDLDDIGGASYLSSLMDGVPKSLNVEYYAQIIKEKALLRRLILSSAKIISSSYEQREDADQLLDEAQASIIEVAEQRIKPGFVPVGALTEPALDVIDSLRGRQDAVTGIPTGFRDLDSLTSGYHKSEFIVVAGRPSMGKTALCLNTSLYLGLRTEFSVGFFSLEMAKEQIAIRLMCAEAQLDIKKVRTGFIGEREFERLKLSAEELSKAKIFIDESPALTVVEMKAKARRLKMEHNLDLVFVDYMQLMRPGSRFENRTQEISYISRSLKELAKELQLPVVGISQLSRAPEKGRREPVPQLSDLRESGAIEQDADVVIFVYRPEFYRPEDENLRGIAKINVAKQRNGPTGLVNLAFIREYARFADMEFQAFEA
jgi:replicative DNA helicase